MADWPKIILTILKLSKKEGSGVDPRFLEIKPRALSDQNLLKALSALGTVLSVIPPTAFLGSVATLGEAGFRIWKRIALSAEYDVLVVDPMGRNLLIWTLTNEPILSQHFGHLVAEERWEEAERIMDDFRFITDASILQTKYPGIIPEYIEQVCTDNKNILGNQLDNLAQIIEQHRHIPVVDQNVRGAIEGLKGIFPAMRDWSMVQSETFDEIVEIIDIVI